MLELIAGNLFYSCLSMVMRDDSSMEMTTTRKLLARQQDAELNRVRLVGVGSTGEMSRVYFSAGWRLHHEPAAEVLEKLIDVDVLFILDAIDYDDRAKACIASLVANDLPIVATPRASASDFLWELKPTAEARGGIMEIATAKGDLVRRVLAISKAVTMRRCLAERHPEATDSPDSLRARCLRIFGKYAAVPASESEKLGGLPGVVQATQFLRAGSGRLDAEKIRELFDFTRKDLALQLKVSAESIRQKSDADSIQPKLAAFERIARLLVLNPKPADFRRWLHAPNSEFGHESPLAVMMKSGPETVADLVEDIITNRGR